MRVILQVEIAEVLDSRLCPVILIGKMIVDAMAHDSV